MRKSLLLAVSLLVSLLAATAQTAAAQTPSAAPGWSRLQATAIGTALQVRAKGRRLNCNLGSVTEDTLTCASDTKPQTFTRAEIRTVKARHRGRSTLAGLGIGAGLGAVVGAPLGRSGSFVGHGAAAVIIAIPGALIGAIVGACTDFTHTNLYKAP